APPKRWGLRLLLLLAVLLLLLWSAPIIVASSPLASWVCEKASGYIDGNVRVGSVSLGWFSPVVLLNVEVRDAADRPIMQVPTIESERCLLRLLLSRDDPGCFRLEKPQIDIHFAGNQS